jgi:hypothetical protein
MLIELIISQCLLNTVPDFSHETFNECIHGIEEEQDVDSRDQLLSPEYPILCNEIGGALIEGYCIRK